MLWSCFAAVERYPRMRQWSMVYAGPRLPSPPHRVPGFRPGVATTRPAVRAALVIR
jgi:hypothetical protein